MKPKYKIVVWILEKIKQRYSLHRIDELQIGERCGCCGEWIPNVISTKDWAVGLCDGCANPHRRTHKGGRDTKRKEREMKRFESIEELQQQIDKLLLVHSSSDYRRVHNEISQRLSLTAETMELREKEDEQEYAPYMGWCDVEGCGLEASGGGVCWRETGYWKLCSDHSANYRNGKQQPKMKQSAIDRENSRDKVTGCLPTPPTEDK